jgi:hypothetical protein
LLVHESFDPVVIHTLRKMADEHRSIAEMVRAILPGRPSTAEGTFEVVRYFREAFALTLPQAKPIADWLVHGGGEQSDLHDLVWPYIESNQASWDV